MARPTLKVHAFGAKPLIGTHRRTLCEAYAAEGPQAMSTSAHIEEVTCRECLRRFGVLPPRKTTRTTKGGDARDAIA